MERIHPLIFRLKSKHIDRDVQLVMANYYDYSTAVQLVAPRVDGATKSEIIATISVNVENSMNLPEERFYGKNYSENVGILECVEEAGLIKCLGDGVKAGFVMLPLYELVI